VTARPTRDVIATWVIADSAMIADGLATALFFTAPEKLAATYNYEYLRMHANGSIEYSEYFAKGVF
jgi:thiamine biosynthesis lipoprotein